MLWQAFGRWGGLQGSSPGGGGGPTNDPYWTSTVLLLSGDGTNGSHIFTDESFAAHGNGTVSGLNNDCQVYTTTKKFGTGSILFDGSNDKIAWADHNDWSFGSGDFTVEGWVYFDPTAIEADSPFFGKWVTGGNQREWFFSYSGGLATNALQFGFSTTGADQVNVLSYNWTPSSNTWYYVAVDRSGNSWRLYVDGSMVASATNSSTIFNSTAGLELGMISTAQLAGLMDELRITKGVARYASDGGFSVPTAAHPRS